MVWNTGVRSPGELLMTFSTSAVAVCCCKELAQIVGALAQFIQQAHVLDGNDGLCGERPQERKLLIRKRSGSTAHDAEQADRLIAAYQGG